MAEFDLKISSRNASRAVGSLPCLRRMYRPSRSSLDVDRPDDLARLGEPREHVLEVIALLGDAEGVLELQDEVGLGGARRADEQSGSWAMAATHIRSMISCLLTKNRPSDSRKRLIRSRTASARSWRSAKDMSSDVRVRGAMRSRWLSWVRAAVGKSIVVGPPGPSIWRAASPVTPFGFLWWGRLACSVTPRQTNAPCKVPTGRCCTAPAGRFTWLQRQNGFSRPPRGPLIDAAT